MSSQRCKTLGMMRARKAGIALDIERKMEERYDEEDAAGTPDRVVLWLNAILEGEHFACTKSNWRAIQFHLRDGVVLCKVMNKLLEADGKQPIKWKPNALTAFIALENIENFNKGSLDYGLPQLATFQSADLYEGHKGPFLNVLNCLNQLGSLANEKGFTPPYMAPEPPKRDAEAWEET